MDRDNSGNSIDLILVGKYPLSLSDHRKEKIIWSMNLINGLGARGYSIRGIHLPNSPFNVIAYNVQVERMYLTLEIRENNTIYFLFTQLGAP